MTDKILYNALGVMSGTSLDGVDIAALQTDGHTKLKLGACGFYPYPQALQNEVRAVFGVREDTPDVQHVTRTLTHFYAECLKDFLGVHAKALPPLDVIGIHGQTITHIPRTKSSPAFTKQLMDGPRLAQEMGIDVVGQFRLADVAAGGEGAPLVPIFQQGLLGQWGGLAHGPVAVLNIGGVANVTYVSSDKLCAFDVGPGNALINDWVLRHTGAPYDDRGALAAQGKVDEKILRDLMHHPFFNQTPPKSLDRHSFPLPPGFDALSIEEGAATLTAFTVAGIERARDYFPTPVARWFVCGGGVRNDYMMAALRAALSPARVDPMESVGIDSDFMEAYAFAYLAVRHRKGLPLTFPPTTGVPAPQTGGILYPAKEGLRQKGHL